MIGSGPVSRSVLYSSGGVLVSTWVVKQEEHTGENEDLDKNIHFYSFY